MKNSILKSCFYLAFLFFVSSVKALPMLDRPYPLPATFDGIITIYPDHENTSTVHRYWIVPSTARIVRTQDNKLAFGLVHSGVSGFDPDGIHVLVNATIQPFVDAGTLQKAKQLISAEDAKVGASSSFNFIVPTETTAQILIGGQPYDWSFSTQGNDMAAPTATVIKGGSVDAGIPFQVEIDKSFDVRALTQAGGDNASTFGVLYTMKFQGIGDRVHAKVTAHFDQVYNHFKAVVSASGWFGLVQGKSSVEWQSLKSNDWIKVQVLQGREGQVDSILSALIVDKLMSQLASRTGFFARQLKPNGLGAIDAPGGGGLWGWSIGVGTGFEHVDETSDLEVEIDYQYTREQQIAFGMSFPSGGPELKDYVKNLTDSNKPFPTSDDFKNQRAQNLACEKSNLQALKSLHDQGYLDTVTFQTYSADALTKGCYVNYGSPEIAQAFSATKNKNLNTMILKMISTHPSNTLEIK